MVAARREVRSARSATLYVSSFLGVVITLPASYKLAPVAVISTAKAGTVVDTTISIVLEAASASAERSGNSSALVIAIITMASQTMDSVVRTFPKGNLNRCLHL